MSRMAELDAELASAKEAMIANLTHEVRRINHLIAKTPTGPVRNALCDAHIHMRAAIAELKKPH